MKKVIKDFTLALNIPEERFPLDETYFVKYYLVSYCGSSCRVHHSSGDYSEVLHNMMLRKELRPDLEFNILRLRVNLQKL